jgi:hypothetical protein
MHTDSQNKAILEHLQNGGKITSLDAWLMFGSGALHSRISQIRNELKIPVQGKRITVVGMNGKKKSVMEYFIDKKTA